MYLFSGRGVRLEPKKKASLRAEIGEPAPCGELVVPLHTLGTSRLETTVGMGGLLLKYAPLAVSGSKNHAVMSPVNGTLLRVETRRHPFYGQVPCALIRPSAQEEELPGARYDLQSITLDEMISAAKTAGIIDEYDGLPLYRKLRALRQERPRLLVADAVDDEPYVTSGMAVLREYPDEIEKGLSLMAHALGAKETLIAVYSPGDFRERKAFHKKIGKTPVLRVSGKYPLWPALAKKLGKDGPFGKIGVQACAALCRMLRDGAPQTDVVITVAGNAVERWKNLRVPVGTPVSYLLEQCGLAEEPVWLVGGGSMTGLSLEDGDVPVVQGMRLLLALSRREWYKRYSCIGCGRCMLVCPVKIMPYFIARLGELGDAEGAKRYGADRCIGCGACAAVCPSGVELTAIMKTVLTAKPPVLYDWGELD